LELTPREINWKVQAWNARFEQNNLDIKDLATLVTIGVNNPKEFEKVLKKFRIPQKTKIDHDKEMRRQFAAIGSRVP
jgi:hypothetical protein